MSLGAFNRARRADRHHRQSRLDCLPSGSTSEFISPGAPIWRIPGETNFLADVGLLRRNSQQNGWRTLETNVRKILIIGGGFAGTWAALSAKREILEAGDDIEVSVISREPYLTMRPRLYEANPETLCAPLAPVFDPVGIMLTVGEVEGIEARTASVTVRNPDGVKVTHNYDRLVLAAGSQLSPPPIPGAAEHSWNIDSLSGAVALDRQLKEVLQTPDEPGCNTFVVVGGGFTGIEMATEMRSRVADHAGPDIADGARVVLINREAAVGWALGDNPRPIIEDALREAGVEVKLGVKASELDAGGVTLDDGERIASRTVIVTTGMRANPLAGQLGVERDELGRLPVDETLRVVGVDQLYATGDIARASVDGKHLALMSCQHALYMGRAAGHNAARDLLGRALVPYRQTRYVTCLDLGPYGAVFTNGWDREVQACGLEAKKTKRMINQERIYPPSNDREAILAAAAPTPPVG